MSDNDLPEPEDDQLPLPPGSDTGGVFAPPPLSALPGKANIYDPHAPAPRRPLAPGVQGPVPQNLAIAPGVLRGAAGKADEVYNTLHQQAASLEEPTSTALKGVHGLQVESALRGGGRTSTGRTRRARSPPGSPTSPRACGRRPACM